jgi:hypothetical protein
LGAADLAEEQLAEAPFKLVPLAHSQLWVAGLAAIFAAAVNTVSKVVLTFVGSAQRSKQYKVAGKSFIDICSCFTILIPFVSVLELK